MQVPRENPNGGLHHAFRHGGAPSVPARRTAQSPREMACPSSQLEREKSDTLVIIKNSLTRLKNLQDDTFENSSGVISLSVCALLAKDKGRALKLDAIVDSVRHRFSPRRTVGRRRSLLSQPRPLPVAPDRNGDDDPQADIERDRCRDHPVRDGCLAGRRGAPGRGRGPV
jgi:hypothetical protein